MSRDVRGRGSRRTLGCSGQARVVTNLRLMTWNILEGGRSAEGQRLDLVAAVVRGALPDVLVVCEAHGLAEDERLLGDLSAAVGMRAYVAVAASGAHVVLFARPPATVMHFEPGVLGAGGAAALAVVRAPGLPEFLLAGVHLDARSGDARVAEVTSVLARMAPGWARIIMGDLNQLSHQDALSRRDLLALPLHHVERHVGSDGEPDTRVTRMLAAAGFVDAWRLAHADQPAATGHTVPTAIPQPPRFGGARLDYVFLSADIPAALTACEVYREKPAPRASDHFPVVADLTPHGA